MKESVGKRTGDGESLVSPLHEDHPRAPVRNGYFRVGAGVHQTLLDPSGVAFLCSYQGGTAGKPRPYAGRGFLCTYNRMEEK
ncbi:hypothetical protein DT065_05100 [Salicibibacter kimchii]|uniref:Uncharacterized protein n=1 Tax=Salicibibacter kimchii TaxID=2099786 RepID=A0A345BWX8_9BACI|nr:hypothetical protein DT065_05100 [Salicibibacter kimchii]